jgi:hypothetical protein
MNWFKKAFGKSANTIDAHTKHDVQFLGEQDGPIEQEIKARWRPIFVTFPDVLRAYLTIASYDQLRTHQVVLCIYSKVGEDQLLINALAQPFREMFNSQTPLDITFISSFQEEDVKKVCKPFYEAS